MQISPVSAFKINFKSAGPHTDPKTGVAYDEGQPFHSKKDIFTKSSDDKKLKQAKQGDTSKRRLPLYASEKDRLMAGVPGYRHEDYLY